MQKYIICLVVMPLCLCIGIGCKLDNGADSILPSDPIITNTQEPDSTDSPADIDSGESGDSGEPTNTSPQEPDSPDSPADIDSGESGDSGEPTNTSPQEPDSPDSPAGIDSGGSGDSGEPTNTSPQEPDSPDSPAGIDSGGSGDSSEPTNTSPQEPDSPDSSAGIDSGESGDLGEPTNTSPQSSPTFDSMTALQEYLDGLPQNTSQNPYPIAISGVDLSIEDRLRELYAVLSRFVALDLRDCTGASIGNALINENPLMENIVSIIFPKTVTEIGSNKFAECPNLVSVEGEKVTTLASAAFAKCPALKSVVFPEVRELAAFIKSETTRGVFSKCFALENVFIPKVEYVGNYTFYDCSSLKTLNLPCVQLLGLRVFKGTAISVLTLGQTVPTLDKTVFENVSLPDMDIYVPNTEAYLQADETTTGWTAELKAVIKPLPER